MTLTIVAAGGALVVGYLVGFLLQRSKTVAAEGRIEEARGELERNKAASAKAIEQERSKLAECEKKLAQANEQSAALRKEIEQKDGALAQRQAAIEQTEAARAKVLEQAEVHKRAWQQAEARSKQAEEAVAKAQQQAESLAHDLAAVGEERDALGKELARRAEEAQRLRAENASLRKGGQPSLEDSVELFSQANASLEKILELVIDSEGQEAAVLADANGIVVAAAGETKLREGMAATTRLVGSITKQLEGMVPFSAIRSFHLQDAGSNVIAGRTFECAGETVGLATYGPRQPADRVLEGAMANLSAILG